MEGKKIIKRLREEKIFVTAGIVLGLTGVCFLIVYITDNSVTVDTDSFGNQILYREGPGEDITYSMKMKTEDMEEDIDVNVSGRKYTEEETEKLFEKSRGELEKIVLSDNKSPDEVRSDLDLVTEIPGTEISVSWETDNYDVIDIKGNLQEDALSEEGTEVKLTALLTYGEYSEVYEFYVRVLPPVLDEKEKFLKTLHENISQADLENNTGDYLILPSDADGKKIEWDYERNPRAFAVLLSGVGAACMLIVSSGQKKREKEKEDIFRMKADYPRIINKFNLYIRAGMTVRKAWFMIAQDYEQKKKKGEERKAYEEMIYTMHRINGGASETECYEDYGCRCGISEYRKFGSILSQNLKKGAAGLTDLLEREAAEAFEERRNLARKAGEEAGTKMMIPMFLMLIIVFTIILVPAFFSIRI